MNWRILLIFSALVAGAGWQSRCLASEGVALPSTDRPSVSALDNMTAKPSQNAAPSHVEIKRIGDTYQLYRNYTPYYIKGIGGRDFLDSAAAAGANSIRTWGPNDADVLLNRAQQLNMTVTLGVWLSHHAYDYADPAYKERKRQEVSTLVERYRNHPALLIWSLGNEINLDGADTRAAWLFVDELARLIKERDTDHPVIAVIACRPRTFSNIAALAPSLDAVGINAYGTVSSLRRMIDHSSYNGPYLITEWGVNGHWEALQTTWGRPIEPTGSEKAEYQLQRYAHDILANNDRCIGSYVFLWGQKQERTPTWYSMFLNDLPGTDATRLSLPAVDAMHYNWTGTWPANRAPQVSTMMINDFSASNNIILSPGEPMVSRIEAADPDDDPLRYVWELLEEPKDLSIGGAFEPRPRTLESLVGDNHNRVNLQAPLTAGDYRLFVYVLDHNGHVSTANIPFQVRDLQKRTAQTGQRAAGTSSGIAQN